MTETTDHADETNTATETPEADVDLADDDGTVSSWRFMFAGGFALGVAATLLLLAVVTAAAGDGGASLGGLFGSAPTIWLLFAFAVATGVGSTLYLLAYESNREWATEMLGGESSE